MSAAALVRMPRAQVPTRTAGLEAATLDEAGALTVEACAMYTQALATLKQIDTLALKVRSAEHSHERADLTRLLEHMRTLVGMSAEGIYRVACDAPRSVLEHVNVAQSRLREEAAAYLWPQKSST